MHDVVICANRKPMSRNFAIMSNDLLCDLRKDTVMIKVNNKHSKQLRDELERTGKRKIDLAHFMGVDPSIISKILSGTRDVSADEAVKMRQFFNSQTAQGSLEQDSIDEIDVRAGMGGGGVALEQFSLDKDGNALLADAIKETWNIPSSYVHNELRAAAIRIKLIEVMGDSMEPTLRSGDRAFIDMGHTSPSPPGVYAVWDGIGLVVKRVEIVPRSMPVMVKLISDNSHHGAYEVSLEEARIVGRVVGKISTM